MKGSVRYATILTLLLPICLPSLVATEDLKSPASNPFSFFDGHSLDEHDASINQDDAPVSNLNTAVTKYNLVCGKTGDSTAVCAGLPYQYRCNLDTGKGSARINNLFCSTSCRCKKVQFDGDDFLSSRMINEQLDSHNSDDRPTSRASVAVHSASAASKYKLICGENGESTTFCKDLPHRYHCDPEGDVLSSSVINAFCNIVCRCEGAQLNDNGSRSLRKINQQLDSISSVVSTPSRAMEVVDSATDIIDTATDVRDSSNKAIKSTAMELMSRGRIEKRHSYAFVCDRPPIKQEEQRRVTMICQSYPISYFCNSIGNKVYITQNDRCDYYCRCINLEPACVLMPEKKPYWSKACKGEKPTMGEIGTSLDDSTTVSEHDSAFGDSSNNSLDSDHQDDSVSTMDKRAETIDENFPGDATASLPILKCFGKTGLTQECIGLHYKCTASGVVQQGSGLPIDKCESSCNCVDLRPVSPLVDVNLIERHTDPNLFGWEAWCGTNIAFRDYNVEQYCFYNFWYRCDRDGNLQRPRPGSYSCDLRCICVQPSRWDGPNRNVPKPDHKPPGAMDETSTGSAAVNAIDPFNDWSDKSQKANRSSTGSRRADGSPHDSHDITDDSPFSDLQWRNALERRDLADAVTVDSPISLEEGVLPNTALPSCHAWVMYCAHYPDGKTSMRNYEFSENCVFKEFMRCSGEGVLYSEDGSDENLDCRKDCFCKWLDYNAAECPSLEQTPPPEGSPTRGAIDATTLVQRVKRADPTGLVG